MPNKLSSTDRKQLCKITEGRFQILHEQLNGRLTDIRESIKNDVLSGHKKDIDSTKVKLQSIYDRRQAAEEETNQKMKEIDSAHKAAVCKLDNEREKVVQAASEKGLKVTFEKRYSNNGSVGLVEPKDITKDVNDRYSKVTSKFNIAKVNLRTMELETLEQISVAGLESDEAKDFLGAIPKIDDLLPSPTKIKELV